MNLELKRTYENIIIESINHVICIDDEFVEPYTQAAESEQKFSREMYQAISERFNCHVEMLRYDFHVSENTLQKYLLQKDLMILDWELSAGNGRAALQILEQTVQTDIPFICIYTNDRDLDNIYEIIAVYFSGNSRTQVEEQCRKWEEAGVFEGDFKNDVEELFSEKEPDTKRIVEKMKKICGDEPEQNGIAYRSYKTWYPLFLQWTHKLLPEQELPKAEKTASGALNINGKCIMCFSKMRNQEKAHNTISADEIIPSLAEHITSIPNNKFDIIWLKYNNDIRNVMQSRTNFLHEVDNRALGYFFTNFINDAEEGNQFFKKLFMDEIMNQSDRCYIRLPELIIQDLKTNYTDIIAQNILMELIKLNEKISVNAGYTRTKHKLDFGDIFVTYGSDTKPEEYWLCITAKCDCFRPEKIDYNYFFIKGIKVNPGKALKKAEEEYYSFLCCDKKYIAVQWENNIRIIHFENGNQTFLQIGSKNAGIYKGIKKDFFYICNLKENYAQRMANKAFSFGNRVGITFAKIK